MNEMIDAVFRADVEAVGGLLEAGANVAARDDDGRTPLMHASIDGLNGIVRLLIDHSADVNSTDNNQWTALHFAAQEGHLSTVCILLESGADVDPQNDFGNTPLSNAVYTCRGDGEIIKALLRHGADKDLKNHHGVSPLDLARSIANYDVAKFFD